MMTVAYTVRDLAALRLRLRALVRSVFSNWSDFQVANFGNVLVDLYAWSADVQGFYLSSNAGEAFIPTATQRRSLLNLAALVGYRARGASAASTTATLTAVGLTADCPVAAGTVVSTLNQPNPVEFQTLSAITLFADGPATATVTVENSTSKTESFTSTGQPNFSITLGHTPYLDGSLSLGTPQGTFTEVASFVDSGPSDKVFTLTVDDNDTATVFFGDGVTAGLVPTGTITATYKTGGGAIGNVAAHSIQQITASLFDVNGGLCQVTCDNAQGATGGTDREGADSIRENAPASLTAPSVSVARTDFEVHARQVGGIDRALYLTSNEDPTIPVNTGYLYVVSPGATSADYPDQAHLDAVRAQFTRTDGTAAPYPMMATQLLSVFPAPFLDVDVAATIYLKKNTTEANVAKAVRASIAAFFATKVVNADGTTSTNPAINFGYYLSGGASPGGMLAESDVANAIRDTAGVREVGPRPSDLTLAATRRVSGASPVVTQAPARQDIIVQGADFPRLGSITLINGDTLAVIP